MKTPTDRQGQVLEFWQSYGAEHGYPPTVRELTAHLGAASSNGSNQHVIALIRKGYMQRPPGGKSRAATLTEAGRHWLAKQARKARRRAA